jgi:hypothetical protein
MNPAKLRPSIEIRCCEGLRDAHYVVTAVAAASILVPPGSRIPGSSRALPMVDEVYPAGGRTVCAMPDEPSGSLMDEATGAIRESALRYCPKRLSRLR